MPVANRGQGQPEEKHTSNAGEPSCAKSRERGLAMLQDAARRGEAGGCGKADLKRKDRT
jgi:hypothetical protein